MNIYVGNLSYNMTEEELQQVFEEFGSVNNVNIIKDRETGNSKGFGFVEMENQGEAENAINDLNGAEVKGRNIKVNESLPRTERPRQNRRSW